jgi:hypothetical protein
MLNSGYSTSNEQLFFTINSGSYGQCFEIALLDFESRKFGFYQQALETLTSNMASGFGYKFYLVAGNNGQLKNDSSRSRDISRIGAMNYRAFLWSQPFQTFSTNLS